MSDSKNDYLSGDTDIMGSSSSIVSSSSDTTEKAVEQGARTPDHLSGMTDIPSPDKPPTPNSQVQEGTAQLEQILRMGPATRPNQGFIDELNGAAQAHPAPVVDLKADGDAASKRTTSQANTSD